MWYADDDVTCVVCGEIMDMQEVMVCGNDEYLCSACKEVKYDERLEDWGEECL